VRPWEKIATKERKVELGKFAEEGDGKARRRLNDFHAWAGYGEGGGEPRLGVGVTMNEQNAGGFNIFGDPAEKVFPGSVSGKVEVADFAADGERTALFAPVDGASLACFSKKASGGRGFGVTDEEDGVVFPRKEKACDGVAGSFGSHHASAEEVNMASAESKAGQAARVECFGLGFGDEAEICVLAGGEGSLAVVNFGHGPAQSTDIDGGGRNFPCETGMVKKGDDFLSFAHGEDGHEDGSTAFEGGANGGEEFFFKVGTILARDGGLGAAGCFHDQGIERAGGSLAR
jgi:hypothetical protein